MTEGIARQLGKYQIVEQLGRGGFATVYRARDPDLERDVALKVLHSMLMTDPTFVERFRREARAAGRLHHPGIVTIYEIGETEGMLYIAMQLLPGPPLASLIAEEAPLSVERAVELLRPLAEALDFAHAQGVVHRDLKPSNIILSTQGRPVLSDFGLVRAAEGDLSSAVSLTLAQTGMTLGTPAYMAPEQAEPEEDKPIDHRADLYSLAVVAYEMLTGRVPFHGSTPLSVAMGHVMKDPPSPRELNPTLSRQVEAALLKALAKAPEERFQNGKALVNALSSELTKTRARRPRQTTPPQVPRVPSQAPAQVTCPTCGAANQAQRKFCTKCGVRLDATPASGQQMAVDADRHLVRINGGWQLPKSARLLGSGWRRDAKLKANVQIPGAAPEARLFLEATRSYFLGVGFGLETRSEYWLRLRRGTGGKGRDRREKPATSVMHVETWIQVQLSYDSDRELIDLELKGEAGAKGTEVPDLELLEREFAGYIHTLNAVLARERE